MGETNFHKLIKGINPKMQDGEYMFCMSPLCLRDVFRQHDNLSPVATFEEAEGTTLILPADEAKASGLRAEYPCRMITLQVNSSLAAIGFMAAIATRLAEHGISVNPVSAFNHDHLFVPADKAEESMKALHSLKIIPPVFDY